LIDSKFAVNIYFYLPDLTLMSNNRDDKFLKKIGANVKSLREAKGLTTRGFADLADISYSQVWRIETGKHDPSIGTLLAIAQALDVSLNELLPNSK